MLGVRPLSVCRFVGARSRTAVCDDVTCAEIQPLRSLSSSSLCETVLSSVATESRALGGSPRLDRRLYFRSRYDSASALRCSECAACAFETASWRGVPGTGSDSCTANSTTNLAQPPAPGYLLAHRRWDTHHRKRQLRGAASTRTGASGGSGGVNT